MKSISYSTVNNKGDDVMMTSSNDLESSVETLEKLCSSREGIHAFGDIPALVRALIRNFQNLKADQLINIWQIAPSKCQQAKEIVEQGQCRKTNMILFNLYF